MSLAPAVPVPPAAAAPAGAAVSVEDVVRTFDGRIRALRGVSLRVEAGEFLSISGPSGSGKSTLLQIVGGLERPDAGDVLVDGRSLVRDTDLVDYRRHVVGFIFQLHHLLPDLTAQGNVEVAMLPLRVHRRERRRRAAELLDQVGLGDRAVHLPAELSGGERQKVAIARALANRPRLLLADEPTGSLDSDSTDVVLDLLADLNARLGMTLVVVTHDPAVTARAHRHLDIVDGRIVTP